MTAEVKRFPERPDREISDADVSDRLRVLAYKVRAIDYAAHGIMEVTGGGEAECICFLADEIVGDLHDLADKVQPPIPPEELARIDAILNRRGA